MTLDNGLYREDVDRSVCAPQLYPPMCGETPDCSQNHCSAEVFLQEVRIPVLYHVTVYIQQWAPKT